MLELKKAVSLESLRLPFRASLAAAAEIGAPAVELNARTMLRPQELSRTGIRQILKWLNDYRLKVAVISFPTRRSLGDLNGLDRRIEALRGAMSLAAELGCQQVSNPIGRIPDDLDSQGILLGTLSDLARHSLKVGAWLSVRTGSSSGKDLGLLLEQLPNEAIGVDFDPAELMLHGHSPGESLEPLAARVTNVRARDAVRDLARGAGQEVQLGRGSIDFPQIFGKLEEHNFRGFVTVERQVPAINPRLECQQALEYLDNLFA